MITSALEELSEIMNAEAQSDTQDMNAEERRRNIIANTIIRHTVELIYITAYSFRRDLNIRNVRHIKEAVTTSMVTLRAIEASIELNEMENTILNQCEQVRLSFNSNLIMINRINVPMVEQLLTRNEVYSDDVVSGVLFMLAVLNQHRMESSNVCIPDIKIYSIKNVDKFMVRYRSSKFGCNFYSKDLTPSPQMVWEHLYSSVKLPSTGGAIQNILNLFNRCYMDIMPDPNTVIGLIRFPVDAIGYRGNYIMGRTMMPHNYMSRYLFRALTSLNRIMPTFEELLGMVTTRPAIEAMEDEVDDDPITDEGDPADDGEGDNPDEGDPADDGEGDNPDEGDQDDPNRDNSDDPSDENTTENTEPPNLLKLNLELPKDETLDDILYKISVARYISELKETRTDLPVNLLTALTKWRNIFLFMVSAKETKRFLSRLKTPLKFKGDS